MKLVALGEILIDFLQKKDAKGLPTFVAQPGGAPANVACAAAKLGADTAFIGKVGDDQFGSLLEETLQNHCVETKHLTTTKDFATTLAFVHIDDDGDRSFSFYRDGCADTKLAVEDIDVALIENCEIFHFGSNSFTSAKSAAATMFALKTAKEAGALISFDPNIRTKLWQNERDIKPSIERVLSYAHIIKLSEEELVYLTGKELEEGLSVLENNYEAQLFVVTLGEKGVMYCFKGQTKTIQGHRVHTIDTTGAGDSFVGAMLAKLLEKHSQLMEVTPEVMDEIMSFANAAAALCTTKNGAIPSLPTYEEVKILFK